MKKFVFFIILLFYSYGNAQPGEQVSNYETCDDNNDGIAEFILASKNIEILNGLDPNQYSVFYYNSYNDLTFGVNSLNTSSYFNITPNEEILYAVRWNNLTNTVEGQNILFNIKVNPLPTATPASLFFCDEFELPIYNLDFATPQILGGQSNMTVIYYPTVTNAQNNSNPILNSLFVPMSPSVEVLGVRVQNQITGCYAITTLTLNTNNCTTACEPPTNLTATNINGNSAIIGWTNTNPTIVNELCIVPFGSPEPIAAIPGLTAQTSPFLFTGLTQGSCYSVYVRSVCDANQGIRSNWSAPISFCMVDCTNNASCPESLNLVAFVDSNNNGTKDTNEVDYIYGSFAYEINNSGTTLYGTSNNGNFYIAENNPSNTYNLSYTINSDYSSFFSCSANYSSVSVPTGSGSNTYYFPITQLQPYNDLEIQIIPNGSPRPGFVQTMEIQYKNKATQMVNSGTINFTHDPLVSLLYVSESSATTTSTGFSFAFTNLAANESRSILLSLQIPTIPTVFMNQILTNSATIDPVIGDTFPLTNSSVVSQAVVAAFDPNDKMEIHGREIDIDEFTTNDYLTYTIRFENVGNGSAEFIRVEDALDSSLNENSLIMVSSSHNYNMTRTGNQLVWNFYNINLPPTSVNSELSHGYIQFRIKPNVGFAIGDIIPNTADIYFDYNPPITTNTFETEFVEQLKTVSFSNFDFVMHPNPAESILNINSETSLNTVRIYDVIGKSILEVQNFNSSSKTIDVSELSSGIYFVEVTTYSNAKTTKKLVIK
jgi:uncharacterized repeat protein (TIGR01451 family)